MRQCKVYVHDMEAVDVSMSDQMDRNIVRKILPHL